jgi:hypothetical protein
MRRWRGRRCRCGRSPGNGDQRGRSAIIRNGKHVESRFKQSDAMLRLLMQGRTPTLMGGRSGAQRGAGQGVARPLDKRSRKRLGQEAYMEYQKRMDAPEAGEALVAALTQRIMKLRRRREEQDYEDGGGV